MQNAQLEIPTLASAITVAVADNTALIALVLNFKSQSRKVILASEWGRRGCCLESQQTNVGTVVSDNTRKGRWLRHPELLSVFTILFHLNEILNKLTSSRSKIICIASKYRIHHQNLRPSKSAQINILNTSLQKLC